MKDASTEPKKENFGKNKKKNKNKNKDNKEEEYKKKILD
jgi:hypothetical protein